MLTLMTYYPAFGEPAASPFCVKAMILLEMSGQDWQPECLNDPRKGPKGKMPVLRDGTEVIPDSDAIRTHLESRYGADFDAGLDARGKGVSRAVIRMAEEHLYFMLVCNRWLDDDNWPVVRKTFFGAIPKPVNGLITSRIRAKVARNADGQGMGRFTPGEMRDRLDLDLAALAAIRGDKPFLFGDAPTAADASVVPMLRGIVASAARTPVRERIAEDAELMAYLARGAAAMYPAA